MAQFQFNNENQNIGRNNRVVGRGFAGRLIKWGLAKNEAQANLYLVALVVVCIGITVFNIIRIL